MRRSESALVDVRLEGISKRFGATLANDHVDLRLSGGTIHGLIGENGAGKSTLMKTLFGLYQPDAGRIVVDGSLRRWRSPLDAIRAGIGMVHQHFMLVPEYSVLENLLVGVEPVRGGLLPSALRPIDRQRAQRDIAAVATRYGLDVPLAAPVESLAVGMQQRVEILKALCRSARVLILDEPTAVLTPLEARGLFANLRRLAEEGCAVVIITHKLAEILALCDTVTVLRAGRVVGTADPKQVSERELASLMVGHDVALRLEVPPGQARDERALELRGASHVDGRLRKCNLDVHAGEIVGVAGVEGNGQSELIEMILFPARARAATHRILGRDARGLTAGAVRRLGVGVIPEDRHRQGLLLSFAAEENCLLGHDREPGLRRFGLWSRAEIRAAAQRLFDAFDVRPRDVGRAIGAFSGGNQQKLIVGRELGPRPRLVIAAQPTRGVDVGAVEQIHRRLVQARDAGAGVLLISADLEEVLTLSDRIIVLYAGRIVAELSRSAVAGDRQAALGRIAMAMAGAESGVETGVEAVRTGATDG